MKIIEPSAVLIRDFDGAEVMKFIEKCGRTCYQSEKNITEDSAEKFIRNLIKHGHESVFKGATPEQARAILPNSLKTEIVMTCNLREWRMILKLRTANLAVLKEKDWSVIEKC